LAGWEPSLLFSGFTPNASPPFGGLSKHFGNSAEECGLSDAGYPLVYWNLSHLLVSKNNYWKSTFLLGSKNTTFW
jgi:hypothetical protein